jgi:hypothetical protein
MAEEPQPNADELTPQEEAKFTAFLKKHAPAPTAPPAPPAPSTPAPSSGAPFDIEGAISRVLDAREGKNKSEERFTNMERELAALKTAHTGGKRKWFFSPLFGD